MKSMETVLRSIAESGFAMFITLDGSGVITGSGGFGRGSPDPDGFLSQLDLSLAGIQELEIDGFRYQVFVHDADLVIIKACGPYQDREDYLQDAVNDAIADVMIMKDPHGKWMKFNRAAEVLRSSSPHFDSENPFITPECQNSDRDAWLSESYVRQDERLADGRIFDVTKTPIRKPDGTPRCLLVFARDVTEARNREAKLQALNGMITTLKEIDRLILNCTSPESLLKGVVSTLADSVILRSCSGFLARSSNFGDVFFKPPDEGVITRQSFRALDDADWSDPVIKGGELVSILPELKGDLSWTAVKITSGDNLCGYLIARTDFSFQEVSGTSVQSIVSDVAGDIAYALQAMELGESQKKSASQILETRNMLDSFLEYFPGPAFIRDSGSKYLKMNRKLSELFGGDHFTMRKPEGLYPEETLETLLRRDREVLEKGYLCRRRVLKSALGGERTFEVHYFRMDREGKDPLIGGIALDITERLESDRALLQSEEKYRAIYENTGTAMAIIDTRGIITSVNANTVELSGYSMEEITGRKHWTEFVHPDDRDMVRKKRRLRLQSDGNGQYNYEFRLVRKDGSVRHVRIRTGTIPNTGGAGVISLSDVTSLIDYQKQLNHSLEKTQAILGAIPDIMFVLTRQGRYRDFYASDEKMLAIPPEEMGNRSIEDLGLSESSTEVIMQAIGDTISEGSVHHVEYELDLPDGHHFYEAGMSPFENDSVLVLCRDVTARKLAEREQKNLEAQIRHVQKLESLGVLAGGIAHDFNNILMAVTGNVYLARKALAKGQTAMEYLDAVEKAAGRASDLAGQMLAYSGRGEFRITPLHLNSVADEISGILNATVSKKAEIVYDLDPELPMIMADDTQVRQVIMNLITNASEALEEKPGRISISTGVMFCNEDYLRTLNRTEELKPGKYAWIQVDDTGRGMNPDVMARIFDPFFTTKFTGRGLGLSAVLGIMSSHAGALKISSSPGKGSSFRALFPVTETGENVSDESGEGEGEWQDSGTVLFIDDEPVIRSVARTILTSAGFNVITASDGLDGLNMFCENRNGISLVILDLTMPNMDGDEVFRKIREIDKSVPVIVSSGYNENEILARFSGCPPDGFLKKPYTAPELRNKIGAMLHP